MAEATVGLVSSESTADWFCTLLFAYTPTT